MKDCTASAHRHSTHSLAFFILAFILFSNVGDVHTARAQGTPASDAAREGPFERLIIRDAMVIPGHGGPAYGPADIIIEGNTIVQIIS